MNHKIEKFELFLISFIFRSIQKQDLRDYIDMHYKAPRIVLAGSGGVKHNDLVKIAEKELSKLQSTFDMKSEKIQPCRFTGSEVRVRDDSLPLAHIAIAVEGCGWTDQDNIPLMVANTLIGAWDRSQGGGVNNASNLARASAESSKFLKNRATGRGFIRKHVILI